LEEWGRVMKDHGKKKKRSGHILKGDRNGREGEFGNLQNGSGGPVEGVE